MPGTVSISVYLVRSLFPFAWYTQFFRLPGTVTISVCLVQSIFLFAWYSHYFRLPGAVGIFVCLVQSVFPFVCLVQSVFPIAWYSQYFRLFAWNSQYFHCLVQSVFLLLGTVSISFCPGQRICFRPICSVSVFRFSFSEHRFYRGVIRWWGTACRWHAHAKRLVKWTERQNITALGGVNWTILGRLHWFRTAIFFTPQFASVAVSLATCDDDVELHVLGRRVDILGTNCDQCVSMVQCRFTST